MKWKEYEKEILKYFQQAYPKTRISFDQSVLGRYSKVERQIDILIEGDIAGYKIRVVVDCKLFSRKIDVKQVESFSSMVKDVGGHQGVLITSKGYSKAAINRAFYGDDKIELDIINFDELHEYQGLKAFPYIGKFAVITPAPFGWVLDLKDRINSFATLHQRGISLKQARKSNEWMYMQFWKLKVPDFDINHLIENQNNKIQAYDPQVSFEYDSSTQRSDGCDTRVRIAHLHDDPYIEATGFIQFDSVIFFIVLHTPKELLDKNLRKLKFLLESAIPCTIEFNNHAVIEQALEEVTTIKDLQSRAEKYFQVGTWYEEMDDHVNSFSNFKLAIECFPEHYSLLKEVIGKALSFNFNNEAYIYGRMLFHLGPKNPTTLNDLIDIFFENEAPRDLINLFKELTSEHDDPEILGNINFHFSLLYLNLGELKPASDRMQTAKALFEKVLPREHQVFNAISEFQHLLSSTNHN
ncbi:MAG: restriction endonuclease [Flavobacteriales bacterium]